MYTKCHLWYRNSFEYYIPKIVDSIVDAFIQPLSEETLNWTGGQQKTSTINLRIVRALRTTAKENKER